MILNLYKETAVFGQVTARTTNLVISYHTWCINTLATHTKAQGHITLQTEK